MTLQGSQLKHARRRPYDFVRKRSAGLRTPKPPRFSTWVYTIVVATSRCPSSSCTVKGALSVAALR
jgi:hypothetical protein